MAQHGYAREYDEGWDRSEDRDRWRDEDRERGWRGSDRGWRDEDRGNERNRNFMLGDRDRSWERSSRDDDRGFFGRMGEEARSWLRDDDREARGRQDRSMSHYGREHGYGGYQGDFSRGGREQGGFGGRGDWERSPRNFSSHQDDHYRSWRDQQMGALDRDYEDYCREREQQFHQDFDSWRQNRQAQGLRAQPMPGQGIQSQGVQGSHNRQAGSSDSVMELDNPAHSAAGAVSGTPTPMEEATLGTNTETSTGPSRRR
ncbi:MAG: hypothetical protein ACJ8E0_09995 [Sphingomicrobium sp.]